MMLLNSKKDIVLKAGGFALIWVFIVTYTTFPELFRDSVSFLSEQISFENTGKFLLFQTGIYLFDLLVQISYSIDKYFKRNKLIVGALGGAVVCALIIPIAIDREMPRIVPILTVAIQMVFLKAFNLYYSDDAFRSETAVVQKIE